MTEQRDGQDVAIVADGLFGCLVALALLAHRPEIRLSLFVHEHRITTARPELLLIDRLSPASLALWESAIVRRWDRHYVVGRDFSETIAGNVALIDPGQLYLDLLQSVGPSLTIVREPAAGGTDAAPASEAAARSTGLLIDVREGATRDLVSRSATQAHRDLRQLHRLDAPILADFSFASDHCDYLELVPLDGSRVMAHHLNLLGGPSGGRPTDPPVAPWGSASGSDHATTRRAGLPPVIPLRTHWADAFATAIAAAPSIDSANVDAICRSQWLSTEALCAGALQWRRASQPSDAG